MKFKNKKTKITFNVLTPSIIDAFKKNREYIEINDKKISKKANNEENTKIEEE